MKSTVLIVAKTKMNHWSCVGGFLANGRFVRLLSEDGYNQDEDCEYAPGDVYEIEFVERTPCTPPHIEDICLSSSVYKKKLSSAELIKIIKDLGKPHFWEGSSEILFDQKIKWTEKGSGYVNHDNIPESSVGFWLSDKPLTRNDYKGRVRYSYPPITRSTPMGIILGGRGWRNIPSVGFQEPVEVIPAGTLLRVSLARWWAPEGEDVEERCYLQLSGWYETLNEAEIRDLPF